ncbi:putative MscS family protein-like protein [Hapsidospora chrysogenum ATCC 11550]|uniref:Putative MscS family protein-like protein n=1 Tax=Hapsidospora chrysogenum (strain ATCC 11550 / CBS 779.69 / DSM 880 / IAM 14645 / JCM 23072 / IMI 49137) TaxID=857340 RepID=A0A086THC4_HAPC1|nr:putative MscS family protein-like protein [Hapsidospora chrysogenum ATCC 11550]
MPARPSSLTRPSGFVQLSSGNNNMTPEDGIQLTTVKSHASTTGARKTDQIAHSPSFAAFQEENQNEKDKGHSHNPFHRHRGRRQKKGEKLGRSDTGDDDDRASLNFMGRLYYKIIGFSVVSRYLVYIIPIAIVLAIPLIVIPILGHRRDVTLGRNGDTKGPPLFKLFLWIEITWLTAWVAKLVAWFVPKLFMFFSGIVSSGTKKYATVLKNLSIPLSLFFWALAVWVTFKNLFARANSDGIGWVKTLETILGATFVSSAVFLGEKAIVQIIGVSYHQRSFANRIKDSKREIHLLGLLYDASRTIFPMYCPEFAEEDYVINDSIELMLGKKKSGSVTPMRIIGDVGRFGGKVTSAFGNIASEITGKNVFNPNAAHSIVLEALEKFKSSEALARRIWMSFVVEGRDSLYMDDFLEVLGPTYEKEAEEAFHAIDGDNNGDISLQEMIRKVVEMGKERKAIGEGMKDIGQALGAFDKVLLFVVLLIVIFVFLAFFQSSFITTIATAGTALLSLSFIFAVTCQEFLGSCIFLFVKHPYDVGDRVVINNVQLVVERISLLYSVFTRSDTQQVSQIPNIVLNGYWVDNITRSKAMYESFEIDISFDTSFEDIELLRLEMEKFVRDPENSRDFKPDFTIGIGGVGSLDKLTLQISILHKSNWHNDMVRASRRSKFMCALATALRKIPIHGPGGGGDALGGPDNPTYSVSVSDEFASKARDESAKSKKEARLVPPPETEEEAKAQEEAAVSGLSARPPVREMGATGQWDSNNQLLGGDLNREASQRRGASFESTRSGIVKRASTSGRRRAGEGLHSYVESGQGAQASPISPTHSRRELWDEEAQAGGVGSPTDRAPQRGAGSAAGPFSPHQRAPPPAGQR